jgi:cytosine/adenosine deaminase-related metal-dependent hydrolase
MTHTLLLKNAKYIIADAEKKDVHKNISIYIEGNAIAEIGSARKVKYDTDYTLDASNQIVLPGLINTHHHLYQTLFRCIPAVENAPLFDWLVNSYRLWSFLDENKLHNAVLTGIAELLLSGCTTCADHFYIFPNNKNWKKLVDAELSAVKSTGIRFVFCKGSMTRGKSQGGLPPDELVQDEKNVIYSAEKVIAECHDTNRFSMLQVALAPCSPFSVTTETMQKIADIACRRNILLHTHISESAEEEKYCISNYKKRAVDFLKDVNWLHDRVWLAHCVHLTKKDIQKIARANTAVAYCATANQRLGTGIAPVVDMCKRNIRVSIGVDGSGSNDSSSMLLELRTALLLQRIKYSASEFGVWHILSIATNGGARTLHRKDEIGVLKEGFAADFVTFNLKRLEYAGAFNPISALIFCAPTNVVHSVINGRIIVKNGIIKTIPVEKTIRLQNRFAMQLRAGSD